MTAEKKDFRLSRFLFVALAFVFLLSPSVSASDEEYNTDDYYPELLQSPSRVNSKSGNCRIVYLMHSRSEDILTTLKEIFDSDITSGALTISQNASSNAIVMRFSEADSPLCQDVYDVIDSLDYKTGQVLIDVLVVELTVSDDDVLNAEWKELFTYKSDVINVAVDHGNINQNDPMASSSGFKTLITSGNKMKAFLNAFQKRGRASVISSPHIITANHRQAVFKTGEKIPLIESTRPSTNGPINSYEVHEVGLELTVTPHINRFGDIDLEVEQTINSIKSYDPKTWTARMANREAKTNLTLSDGQTMVLGGFIEEKTDKIESRIPLLSDIPGIGKAFRSRNSSKTKTELMVFITPKIITTQEDADQTTKTMVARTQQKKTINSLLEQRRHVEPILEEHQEIIIDRRSEDWLYEFEAKDVEDLVWIVPQKFDEKSIKFTRKGSAPFGFGNSKRLLPAPVKTYIKPSEGVIFTKKFFIDNPEIYRNLIVKVAADDASAVYINGRLVDEDPMMKMKDGHAFQYWNRHVTVPGSLLNSGENVITVFLGNEEDSLDAYFDVMLIGNKR